MKKYFYLWVAILVTLCCNTYGQNPVRYWHFDSANGLADSMGVTNLDPAYFQSGYDLTSGGIRTSGKHLTLGAAGNLITGGTLSTPDDMITVEFCIKPGRDFNQCQVIRRRDNAVSVRFYQDYLLFTTTTDNMEVEWEGVNGKNWAYYTDGNWHHMVFMVNAPAGTKKIYVDGQLLATKSITPTTIADGSSTNIDINNGSSYLKIFGGLDQVAVYDTVLSDSVIAKHYNNAIVSNSHYSFSTSGSGVTIPSRVFEAPVDTLEFAKGYSTGNYLESAYTQLYKAPDPRFRPADSTLLRNMNWMGLNYFSSHYQTGVDDSTAVRISKEINYLMATKWNYYLLATDNTSSNYNTYNDTTKFNGAWVALCNRNPTIPASAISFWSQISPSIIGKVGSTEYNSRTDLPSEYYLRNSGGQFINQSGVPISSISEKLHSPISPLDSLAADGAASREAINRLCNALTRPLNYISENDEVIKRYASNILAVDPNVVTSRSAASLSWDEFSSQKMTQKTLQYRNQIMSLPKLVTWKTKYVQYQLAGDTAYRFNWKYTRNIQDEFRTDFYQERFATQDFYPRWPSNWRIGTSAWNGLQRIVYTLPKQYAEGDTLFAPFVAAGWDVVDSVNIRPGQYLGLLKLLSGLGATYFHSGFFNEAANYNSPNPPPANPAMYAYQAMMPIYAQAASRRWRSVYENSEALPGDYPMDYTNGGTGYSFKSGDPNIVTVVRKSNLSNTYLIFTALERYANDNGNAPTSKTATISLAGRTLSFTSRLQGSIYLYRIQPGQDTIFLQLDKWHEYSHPSRWSKTIEIEAEVSDRASLYNYRIKTDQTNDNHNGNYTSFTTWAKTFSTSQAQALRFTFTHTDSTTVYIWVRAAKLTTANQNMKVNIDGINNQTFKVTSTDFEWYGVNVSNADLAWTNVKPNVSHFVRLFGNNNIKIDKIIVTEDSSYAP
jgi:hypothetical protein